MLSLRKTLLLTGFEMKNRLHYSIAIIAPLTLYAGVAHASDTIRAEALVGWDHVGQSVNATSNVIGNDKLNGITYGGNLGFDLPIAPVLSLGFDASAATSSATHSSAGYKDFHLGRDLYAGARVSWKLLPGLQAYAKAGYANTRFTTEAIGRPDPAHGGKMVIDPAYSSDRSGLRLGLGIQRTIFGPAYLLAEYNYTHYSADISRNQVIAGVGFRF